MISWSLRAWSWRLLQAHDSPHSFRSKSPAKRPDWWKRHRDLGPIANVDEGASWTRACCRWFIAWVAHVVHNCWWQQKGVHYPHCYKNESHTAKRHEEKGVAVEALNQKSVRWWFLFWLVRKGCFKCSIHFQQKVKSTFKTPFKANSLQGGFVCFLTASIKMPL